MPATTTDRDRTMRELEDRVRAATARLIARGVPCKEAIRTVLAEVRQSYPRLFAAYCLWVTGRPR